VNPLLLLDGYKTDHRSQYPKGTEYVYSNWTPRKSRIDGIDEVVFFGLQYYMQRYLIDDMGEYFFSRPKGKVVDEYRETMDEYLGEGAVKCDHIADLHDLGYLPIRIKALPEGTLCPIQVPMLTMVNTLPDFFWLTNQLETSMSSCLWMPCTSATLAYQYRKAFNQYNAKVGIPSEAGRFQGHDFSFRGLAFPEASMGSGAAHLTSFQGTDTVPAIKFVQKYYAKGSESSLENGLIGCSVPATEHSVMCMGGQDNEVGTYRRLINEVYPRGIVSIVSDTWDFWLLMTDGLRALKSEIMARDGKVVIRPDSGDPVKIVCGDPDEPEGSPAYKGAYQCLWGTFGGEYKNGYKFLDKHVGLIYGDSITLQRQAAILEGLLQKGFAPEVVLGIGSYTYQYQTRDTFGFALKATYGVINGESKNISKSPKTDKSGEKKSLCGRVSVHRNEAGKLYVLDKQDEAGEQTGVLRTVFENGKLLRSVSLADVRYTLHGDNF